VGVGGFASRAALCIAAAIAILATASTAKAEYNFQFATQMGGGWLRETPDFDTGRLKIPTRNLRDTTVKSDGGIGLWGGGFDIGITVDDRWQVPILGANGWWATGNYDRIITSWDGSILRERPSSTFRGDILLPGFGRRWKIRRNLFGINVRTGISWIRESGSVAAGTEWQPVDFTSVTFLVEAEIEACRRLDPTTRVCLQVTPRIYDHSSLNGVNFGIRMEWGR
jgi:hypothetical protein